MLTFSFFNNLFHYFSFDLLWVMCVCMYYAVLGISLLFIQCEHRIAHKNNRNLSTKEFIYLFFKIISFVRVKKKMFIMIEFVFCWMCMCVYGMYGNQIKKMSFHSLIVIMDEVMIDQMIIIYSVHCVCLSIFFCFH